MEGPSRVLNIGYFDKISEIFTPAIIINTTIKGHMATFKALCKRCIFVSLSPKTISF